MLLEFRVGILNVWDILFVSIITITITGTTTVLIFSPLFVLPFFGLLGFALGMPREVLFGYVSCMNRQLNGFELRVRSDRSVGGSDVVFHH